jgi:hypothetical protein
VTRYDGAWTDDPRHSRQYHPAGSCDDPSADVICCLAPSHQDQRSVTGRQRRRFGARREVIHQLGEEIGKVYGWSGYILLNVLERTAGLAGKQ